MPGVSSGGSMTYGRIFSPGMRVHPSSPASAMLAPMYLRKLRRVSSFEASSVMCRSSVARGAARQAAHVILRRQRRSEPSLCNGGRVSHHGHGLDWPQPLGWHAMTTQTPAHRQWLGLIDGGHLVDATMAALAAHALVHVDGMIEVHEVRQSVHAIPCDRLASLHAATNRREVARVDPHGTVTRHARLCWWNPGGRRPHHRRVAVLTADAETPGVDLMIERNRLRYRLVARTRVRRPHERHQSERDADHEKCEREQTRARSGI